MNKLLGNGVKIFIGIIVIMIVLSLLAHLVQIAIRIAVIAAIGYGIYIGGKKIGLIKGK
jgi:small-conductance mechanosensitive channel